MQKFQPYIIKHITLNDVDKLDLKNGNYYIVIWCNQIPLGHIWFDAHKSFSKQTLFTEIKNAIYKTVAFYMQYNAAVEWEKILAEENFAALNEILAAAIKKFAITDNKEKIENISVVICTRNRPIALKKCIQSLLNNEDKNFELIVVDNAPDNDDTKKIVEQFPDVRYVFEERKGLDIARNTGAKA